MRLTVLVTARDCEIESVSLADYPRVYSEFIEERNLNRVVLVGNRIGGLMVQLTMQAIPHRIVHGIWYMAFILADGECVFDACPPEFSQVPDVKDNRYATLLLTSCVLDGCRR